MTHQLTRRVLEMEKETVWDQTCYQTHHQYPHEEGTENDIHHRDQRVMVYHPPPKFTWELVFQR